MPFDTSDYFKQSIDELRESVNTLYNELTGLEEQLIEKKVIDRPKKPKEE